MEREKRDRKSDRTRAGEKERVGEGAAGLFSYSAPQRVTDDSQLKMAALFESDICLSQTWRGLVSWQHDA